MTVPVAAGGAEAAGLSHRPEPTPAPDGARLTRLRAGRSDEKLFLVPGLEGVLDELRPLAAVCTGPQEIYAVAPLPPDAEGRPMSDVEQMATEVLAAIRRIQPAGPYRLGGYSFGGLVALEAARQLHACGERAEALFLIDAVYDERYWPRMTWMRALVRRTVWQLLRIVRMPPARAARELGGRAVRLAQRFARRRTGAPDALPPSPEGTSAAARAYAALARYRPRRYAGEITLIAPSVDRHFGCDTARLWARYATRVEVQRVDGDHLSMMRDATSLAAVAALIDHRLATRRAGWAGLRPVPGFERPMILTTMRWFSAARLAQALAEAGFTVSACRPGGHPLRMVDGLSGDHRLHRLWQLSSLARAIRAARPDIILPDDERALVLLRRLYARTRPADTETATVIARSLGQVEGWPFTTSRAALAWEARKVGVASPETDVINDLNELQRWSTDRGMPIVLKTDGSWGGRGVAIVSETARLRTAWRAISNPPGMPRAVKRLLVNREGGPLAAWATRRRPVVNAQEYVHGREAMVTAVCVHGEVKALVCLEVVEASEPRGPASVVRVIHHPGMAQAARQMAARIGLHGFCGFDFIVTDTGEALLLELNPRITPTAHLLVEGHTRHGQTIVLFPPRPGGTPPVDPNEPLAGGSWTLDVPVRTPALVRCGERMALRQNRPAIRVARRIRQRLAARLDGQHAR